MKKGREGETRGNRVKVKTKGYNSKVFEKKVPELHTKHKPQKERKRERECAQKRGVLLSTTLSRTRKAPLI